MIKKINNYLQEDNTMINNIFKMNNNYNQDEP